MDTRFDCNGCSNSLSLVSDRRVNVIVVGKVVCRLVLEDSIQLDWEVAQSQALLCEKFFDLVE